MTAAKSAKTTDFQADADVTAAPDDWEFETVREEAPIGVVFDTFGDSFVGQFVRKHHVSREPNAKREDMSFDLYVFTGRDEKPYALPNSYVLDEAYENELLVPGKWVRITYVKDIKTSAGLNDMKDFRIEVRK